MITCRDNLFWLDTDNTSYVFRITPYGHPEHIYYGKRLEHQPIEALALKRTAVVGASIVYDPADPMYALDHLCLEWSGIGRGDYRYSPTEIKMPDGSFTSDFIYTSYQIIEGDAHIADMPCARGDNAQTLELTMTDRAGCMILKLYYTVFAETNVIARRASLQNQGTAPLSIRRLLSMMVDLPNRDYKLMTFDGDWIKEAHRHERRLMPGMFVNSSITGASSNRHNPGFLLAREQTYEEYGDVYAFNLLYSGNHFGCAELSPHDLVRVALGINPHCFEWSLDAGETFETPQAMMTFSDQGFHGVSRNNHDFVNRHIVPEYWQDKARPILYNSWEAYFFKYTARKLLKTAKQAKDLGMELFVLDDGWFGARNDDRAGLGDYQENHRKFPQGLAAFAGKLRRMGLEFGLWFEPEMVNEDSDLYRTHPEWAVKIPGRAFNYGRNQLVLDLCNPAVRDYIVDSVSRVLDSTQAAYVKWDMNRHISDAFSPCIKNQGEFYHRYILGLYEILRRIFEPRPHILLETCSSGGNRFDLGMLCYGPQAWVSDCTDPVERLAIQEGLSHLYPQSTFGAHVSAAPHQQTLRETSLSTRFHAACFGCLGYELDLTFLSRMERAEIREQTAYYKVHRKTFQFGRFRRILTTKQNAVQWQCTASDNTKALAAYFQTQASANPGHDILVVRDLTQDCSYQVTTRPQRLFIKRFGGLIRHVLPVSLNPEGFLFSLTNRFYALNDCVESYEGDGQLLAGGILLNNQFMGSEYTKETRLLGDFGSNLYLIRQIESEAL